MVGFSGVRLASGGAFEDGLLQPYSVGLVGHGAAPTPAAALTPASTHLRLVVEVRGF